MNLRIQRWQVGRAGRPVLRVGFWFSGEVMSGIAILGATGTIGSNLARSLVQQGMQVLLVARNREKLDPLSQELGQPFAVSDFRNSTDLENAITDGTHAMGGIHGIVQCIGSVILKGAHLTTDDEFRQTIETNLFSSFAAVKVGAKLMRGQGGSIVLFASAAAEIGIPNHEAIAAAKGGVIAMARSAAATYAPNNIRVNVVSPGLVRTELTRRIWENPSAAAASLQMHALGRLGEPEKIVSLVNWLLDQNNDWITGQTIGVDGGLGHLLPKR